MGFPADGRQVLKRSVGRRTLPRLAEPPTSSRTAIHTAKSMNSSAPSATTHCGRQQVLALPTSGWERMVPQQAWLCQSWQQPTWDSWVEVELRHNRWLQSRPCCQIVCLAQLQRMDPLLASASSTTEVRPCAREAHGFQPIFLSSDDGGTAIPMETCRNEESRACPAYYC